MTHGSYHDGEHEPLLSSRTNGPRPVAENNGITEYARKLEAPAPDRGRQAWLFLAACWAIEALVFGFGLSFGVFQDFYGSHEPFAGSNNIAAIGTTTMGLLYLGTPFIIVFCRMIPRHAPRVTLCGLLLCSLALILSSFCRTVPQLVGTQGVMFGIGGCMAFCPCVLYIDEWFLERKSLALGIMFSASGFGGVVFPPLLELLLYRLGFPAATRIWAAFFFVASTPLAFFIKPRVPPQDEAPANPFQLRFVYSRIFILHQLANIIQATGFFLPGIYLPTYARVVMGASKFQSVLTLMLLNIAMTASQVILGAMADSYPSTACSTVSALGAAVSVLVIWGLATSLPVLYVFCVAYGLLAGGWPSIWPAIMKEVAQRSHADGHGDADSMMIYSLLVLGRGVGNAVSGPLSDVLIRGAPWRGQAVAGYGSGYGVMILYVGLTGLVSGQNIVLKFLGLL